ncbi:MAG TPA: DUF397 domain-containing protein [Streptosporangiaceae bacterium]
MEIAWRRGAEGINILVRDSKFPGRDPLVFTPGEWAVFLDRVKSEDFDVLAAPPFRGPAPRPGPPGPSGGHLPRRSPGHRRGACPTA